MIIQQLNNLLFSLIADKAKVLLLFIFIFGKAILVHGQQATTHLDSIASGKIKVSKNRFLNNIYKQAVSSVEKSPNAQSLKYLNSKSETPFMPYQGKIIRHISINPYNFDQNLNDTNKHNNNRVTRLGKRLHYETKKFVIKDNLFIKEYTPLNAFKVADNERYLRSLEYIHDARIIIQTIKDNPDSVDLLVLTIDLFSIAGGFASDGLNHINTNAYETNLGGMGQRLDLSQLYDYNRHPEAGYGIAYRKNNVCHTFLDATVGYSTMNGNGFTNEEETTEYFTISRQLISPYSRVAGGLTISHNEGFNLYNAPAINFYKYKYNLFDAWGGYNIALKKLTASNNTIRDRRFLAIRYYNRNFTELPNQIDTYNPVYNSSAALLAQITFFRQDYYRTQYIYGFGTTEDLPYGYNLSATVGWHQQLSLNRFYSGISAYDYLATKHGDFIQLFMKTGGFMYKNTLQDATFLIGVTAFSRLIFLNSTKIRQYINFSYSSISNRIIYAPLRINNYYGVRGFLSDSAFGRQRITLQSETEFFLKFNVYNFHFAPFPYMDISVLTPDNQPFSKSFLYSSLGGGIRMRNENLVFETIELRAYFFPVAPSTMKGFKIILNANVRYRYINNFITPPDVVQLNSQ